MNRPAPAASAQTWPDLPRSWVDTYATLHTWTQIVGKVALAQAPPLNHSWGVALQVTARGLITRPLPHGSRLFTIGFDFVGHQLVISTSDGMHRALPLASRTVADFYKELMATLAEMHLEVRIWPVPVEVPNPVRFTDDTAHGTYEPAHVETFWHVLAQCARIFEQTRCQFIGKSSPVHFFWGSFDLAITRFSGRPAPPRDGPAFMREAYSHEVISHGFWPGSGRGTLFGAGPVDEPAFYAYAVPQPPTFEQVHVEPAGAFYHRELGEFILPYRVVRTSDDPDHSLLSFIDSTYTHAADLAAWDRASLERRRAYT